MIRNPNRIDELYELAAYVEGFSDAAGMTRATRLREASIQLISYAQNICGKGYAGCRGGPNCDADHK